MKRTIASPISRVIFLAPLILLAGCHEEVKVETAATPVKVAAVDLYQPKVALRYSASIMPSRQVNLAFRVSGFVTGIHKVAGRGLEPGDIVGAGTVLAHLREEDYRNSSNQAESQLQGAKESQRAALAQLEQAFASQVKAQADYDRAKTLFDTQSLTRPDYDSAKAQLDVTAAQVQAARAQIDAATAQIRTAESSVASAKLAQGDTELFAPFTASVVQRNVEVGMLAGPSTMAYALADIGTVKATFGVPDTVVVKLRPGRSLSLDVEALPGKQFRGVVSSVAAVADSETKLFQVELTVPNGGLLLKPGMIASLDLEETEPAPSVPVIPVSAVVRDQSHPDNFAVMVVEGKIAKSRRVDLGPTFGELLAVTNGLQPGELVIRAGGTMVNDGEAVEVIQ